MRLTNLKRVSKYTKIIKVLLFGFLFNVSLILTSCFSNYYELSTHMDMVIRKAYFREFILPSNPDAHLEDVDYYKFLQRYSDGKQYIYLFAWEVFEDTPMWSFTVMEHEFFFEHEVSFIVYRSSSKSFYSVIEAINEKLFTTAQFGVSLRKLDVYIDDSNFNNLFKEEVI